MLYTGWPWQLIQVVVCHLTIPYNRRTFVPNLMEWETTVILKQISS